MSESSEKNMLRFGCPECGTRLVVDPSLAGKEGPCPSCGDIIIAPPIAAATSLVAKDAPPVTVKPRGLAKSDPKPSASSAPSGSGPTPERRRRSRPSGVVAPAVKSGSTPSTSGRKLSPATAISQDASQSKEVKTLLIMVMITCIVVCIALGVYFYMTSGA